MAKLLFQIGLFLALPFSAALAQNQISGRVLDEYSEPLPGANIILKGTYDGTTADASGKFSFITEETGQHTLIISFSGFATQEIPVKLPLSGPLSDLVLKENFNQLEAVTITAGAFEASDEKKSAMLKPLDIVTTASAVGDISGALNMLPGTQKVAETGRLFVRGGEGSETRTFIDGLWVQSPYNATTGNVPTRSRFSPFMFKGTTFSTGGYSAEYGQALSGTLQLNTTDLATETKTDVSVMSVGGGLAHTLAGQKQSVSVDVNYLNLKPYFLLVPQERRWQKAPESLTGSAVYRYKPSQTGLFKAYGQFSSSALGLTQTDAQTLTRLVPVQVQNRFGLLNATYRDLIGPKLAYTAGAAANYSHDLVSEDGNELQKTEQALHLKNTWSWFAASRFTLRFGAENFSTRTRFSRSQNAQEQTRQLSDELTAAFAEADVYLSKRLALRYGLRGDYSSVQKRFLVSPRLSAACQTSEHTQISAAVGGYNQQPQTDWLAQNPNLHFEQATHHILNYQVLKDNRTFRTEVYHKDYKNLVQFISAEEQISSTGTGYARGLDVFWRDRKSLKNADYWISYSFLDTRRHYLHFPEKATPAFASAHNLSVVYKHFVPKLRTQFGGSFSYTSPRPYHNPNQPGFNRQRTRSFQDLSLNAAFLYRQHIILYASVSNVVGTRNTFGQRFAQEPDASGHFRSEAITRGASRFLFVGVFITLTKDKTQNQLDNL